MTDIIDSVLTTIAALTDEAVAFTADLIRMPTVNPPGDLYEECARFIGGTLARFDFEIEYCVGLNQHLIGCAPSISSCACW